MLQPSVTNIVESSPTGTRPLATNGNGSGRGNELGVPSGGLGVSATKRKVGRNEPCPCGSGKKYKLCHGR
jgi:preprotein translocase subunit SecA